MNKDFKKLIGSAIFFIVISSIMLSRADLTNPGIKSLFLLFTTVPIIAVYCQYRVNYKKFGKFNNITPEFENLYQELYVKSYCEFEKNRKKVRNSLIIQGILLICLSVLLGNMIDNEKMFWKLGIYVLIVLLPLIYVIFVNKKSEEEYNSKFKTQIINRFIKLINNKLEYKRDNIDYQQLLKNYKTANFTNEPIHVFEPDDYITGFLDNETYVEICDLNVKRKVDQYYRNGRNIEHFVQIFQGIFIKTECISNIGTHIKISKNKLKIFENKKRVEMDSQEFEKYFDIYSENKIVTMQLLTSDIMNILVDFYKKYGLKYEIVIKENKIYMRFLTGPMFEPSIFKSSMDKQKLSQYFGILKLVLNVTNAINSALKEI